MTAEIIRFPPRRSTVILLRSTKDRWVILAGEHGWLHGDRTAALTDARWLSRNPRLPIREVA